MDIYLHTTQNFLDNYWFVLILNRIVTYFLESLLPKNFVFYINQLYEKK